jgi:SAM-dependent methyltransferase
MGFRIHTGTVEDAPYPPPEFDLVSLVHVIEHLPDPVRTLARAAGFLRPGGRMFLLTPNADSLTFRFLRGAWYPLESPRHLHLFDARTLARACRRAGLEPVLWNVRPHAKEVFRSAVNCGRPALTAIARSKPGRSVIRTMTRVLNLLFRDGEELRMVAVKRAGSLDSEA